LQVEKAMEVLVFLLPPYVANATPVVTSKFYAPGHPIDMGKTFVDGRRLLGDNKTVEGFVSGVIAGSAVGALLSAYGVHSLYPSIVLSVGAMMGDCLGSFIKRRFGIEPGERALLLDEEPFIVVALAFYSVLVRPLDTHTWLLSIILTFIFHIVTNKIAEIIHLK